MKVKLTSAQKITLSNSTDIYRIMRDVLIRERKFDRRKEHFWIIGITPNNKIVLIELVCFGTTTNIDVEATDVFGMSLQKKASKMILVHNRPSGNLAPTTKDKEFTERMGAIGKFLRLPVTDHLLITEEEYYSFADSGLLKQIMDNTNIDLTFKNIDDLKEQLERVREHANNKVKYAEEKLVTAAKKLLKKGLSIAEIASVTGLSKKEVEVIKDKL